MLHKPVVLKLEEPRVTGKLTQPAPPKDASKVILEVWTLRA